jgi:hypothetical protein
LQQKNYCNIRGESAATTKKAKMKHFEELLCNIRETHVPTTKKDIVATFHIICCNTKNESLQNNNEI